jgi:hypothetical protein
VVLDVVDGDVLHGAIVRTGIDRVNTPVKPIPARGLHRSDGLWGRSEPQPKRCGAAPNAVSGNFDGGSASASAAVDSEWIELLRNRGFPPDRKGA